MRAFLLVIPFACAIPGCMGQTLQLGSNDGGTGTTSSSLVGGKWTGYIESYALPSGSSTLTMVLATQRDGTVTGTVTIGDKSAPPPPSDPNVGYPPGSGSSPLTPASIEGFPYTVQNGSFDGARLRLGISTLELWKAWCGLQKSEPPPSTSLDAGGGEGYGCNPRGYEIDMGGTCGYTDPGGRFVSVDCGRAAICSSAVCDCTPTSCTVNKSYPDITFDMQLAAGHLDGSAAAHTYSGSTPTATTLPIDGRNVHLTAAR